MNDTTNPEGLAAYWKQQIEGWENSDRSQKSFCQANGLSYHRFGYWRRKFDGGSRHSPVKRASGGFATVDYRPEVDAGLTLSLTNGLVLRGICVDNVAVVRQLLDQL